MGKKISRYARKRRSQGKPVGEYSLVAWHNAIERCQPLGDTAPIVPGIKRATDPHALLIEAHEALTQLLDHKVAAGDGGPYECLACVVDVTWLRAIQINPNPQTNPIYEALDTARTALYNIRVRREKLGRWGMAGPERDPLVVAVDHYEAILLASSAAQMSAAEDERDRLLAQGKFYKPDEVPA